MTFFIRTITTFFGLGLLPIAPGTWGSLGVLPVLWWMKNLSPVYFLLVTCIIFLLGTWASHTQEKFTHAHDDGSIVIDEVVGMLLTFFLISISWKTLVVGFFIFRLFDIWKPFPIRNIDQKIPGGLGVMLDDVLAGVYANVVMHLGIYIIA